MQGRKTESSRRIVEENIKENIEEKTEEIDNKE